MLEAKKSEIFRKIFGVYNKNLLKRKFHSLHVSGIENFQNLSLPYLIYANHSSWWDGMVAFHISEFLKLESFIMMEEKQLKKMQLFRRLGAFSVIRENPREAIKSIKYAAKLLKVNSRNTLWIFPQGRILPNDVRPLKFYNGLAHIVKNIDKCSIVPLAMRYEFLGNFKPEIFVSIGKPFIIDGQNNSSKNELTGIFSKQLTELLDELKSNIETNKLNNFHNIL